MELTLGFITLFFVIIVPGLLFRRFFYYGEFSKQFNSKETVYQSIFYSIIPGIFLQLFGAICYFTFRDTNLSFSDIYIILTDILGGSKQLNLITKNFLDFELYLFIIHNLLIYILSIFFGFIISRTIRLLKWDIKYKVFRFKNQWYYIFKGEILLMKKFKSSSSLIGNYFGIASKSSATFADILIENSTGNRELYSGFVVDYDLNNDDISLLDRIYLLDARRYKKDVNGKTVTKKIPGEVFVIRANQILNINLTYIPEIEREGVERLHNNKQFVYKLIYAFVIFTQLFFIAFFIFSKTHSLEFINSLFNINSEDFNLFFRFFVSICIIQIISIISPVKRDNKFTYKLTYLIGRSITTAVLFIIFWLIFL